MILFGSHFTRVLKVSHPDHDIVRFLGMVLEGYRYHLCKVECSFDFVNLSYGEGLEFLNFCRTAFYILYRGKVLPLEYDTTKYFNNVWKCRSAGIKMYLKNDSFLRLEVTLKTPYLRSMGIQSIEDLYKLHSTKVTDRISCRSINFAKWRRAFHHRPANDIFSDNEVQKEIEWVLEGQSLNDAVLLARKYAGDKKFVDIHPFQPIFKAAVAADSFIKDEHPECILVTDSTVANTHSHGPNIVGDSVLLSATSDQIILDIPDLNEHKLCDIGIFTDISVVMTSVRRLLRFSARYRDNRAFLKCFGKECDWHGLWKSDYG